MDIQKIEIVRATILISFCIVVLSHAQITFARIYGGYYDDGGASVMQTHDGGYIIGGYTNFSGQLGSTDVYIIKTDENGDTIWTRVFDSQIQENLGVAECGYSVDQTPDRGYIIAGVYSLIRLDSLGNFLWTKTCREWYFSAKPTSDGGYIVAGGIVSEELGGCDVYLVKTNSEGDTIWTRTYGGNDWDCGYSVLQTSDEGYIISGETSSYGTGDGDVYLVRTNSNGDTIWTKTCDTGESEERGMSIQPTLDGGYIIAAGFSFIKTDAAGNVEWARPYLICASASQTSDSGYVVGGGGGGGDPEYWDLYFTKTDSAGNPLWTRFYGGDKLDIANSIQQTADGGYIVVGSTYSYGSNGAVYLIKTDENGMVEEVKEEQTHNLQKLNFNISPNPFILSAKINYSLPQASYIDLCIYDICGRLIKNIVRGDVEAGQYSVFWDGKDLCNNSLPAGVYFLNLIYQPIGQSHTTCQTQKVINLH